VVTGLDRACRAELAGFASPIGRLSAVLRITDEATRNTATSVVPVELPARVEGTTGTAELTIPPSDVRAREVRVQTAAVRLRLPTATVLEEFPMPDLDGMSAHRQALVLTTALSRGALARA
jgi:hypothetical protein